MLTKEQEQAELNKAVENEVMSVLSNLGLGSMATDKSKAAETEAKNGAKIEERQENKESLTDQTLDSLMSYLKNGGAPNAKAYTEAQANGGAVQGKENFTEQQKSAFQGMMQNAFEGNSSKTDVLARMEQMGVQGVLGNAPMHTGNTGAGAELVPTEVFSSEILELAPKYQTFMQALPGFHGSNMPKKETVTTIGDVGFFNGADETTSGAFALIAGTHTASTGKISIEQKKYRIQVDISREELLFAIRGGNLEEKIKQKFARAYTRTVEAAFLNSDSDTGGTGNVNSDDQAAATTFAAAGGANHYSLKQDDGLRKIAIDTSNTFSVGTAAFDDFISVMLLLGDNASPEDCVWLFNRASYVKSLGIDEFKDQSKNGKDSTIYEGSIGNILGSDVFIPRDLQKTEADGKLAGITPANNVLGQFQYLWLPAMQYGYGEPLQVVTVVIDPSVGITIVGWFFMGFNVVNKDGAGLSEVTDPVVATGINFTL